jgi:uncharacterized protein YuzE
VPIDHLRIHPTRKPLHDANRRSGLRFLLSACACLAIPWAIHCPWQSPAHAQQQNNSAANAVFWSRSEFVIPFQVDASGEIPAEVRLEVSEDSGQTWKLYTRADVRTRQFRYRATSDGEFRFRLKTVDRNGNVYDNPGEPLVVVVDTNKPDGELLVDIDPKGVMLAECVIKDAALDSTTVKLEYQTDANPQWISVPCEVRWVEETGQWTVLGTWDMPSEATQLVVRVVVRDRAGNTSEWTRMPRLPRSAGVVREMKLASNTDGSQGVNRGGVGILRLPQPPKERESSAQTNAPQRMAPQGTMAPQGADVPKIEVLGGPGARKVPTDLQREAQLREQILESQQRLIEYQNRILMQQRATSGNAVSTNTSLNNLATSPVAPAILKLPESLVVPDTPVPPIADQRLQSLEGTDNIHRSDVLHSNSCVFSLDYVVDNDPGAATANIELWGTIDQGDSWERWGVDSDRESPFDIEVEQEGLFGFRMVIVGANGVASRRPLPGDKPDAWVRVDTQIPGCRILSVLNGKGNDAGSLVIEYSATDDHLGDRPISFAWAPNPNGPWQPISQGARNNSRYVWTPDPGLPDRVYLRIEAVDAAGNVGTNQLDLPVDIQGASPRGRFQGVRPQR